MAQPINFWDERFQTEEYVYGKNPNVFLTKMQSYFVPQGEALTIAEGEGRNAVYLAEQGLTVSAWDYAPSGVEKIKRLANDRGVAINAELVDLNTADWERERWDQVVSIYAHFPTDLRLRTLHAIRDAVKSNGVFISEIYSIHQLPYKSGGPQDLSMLYYPEEFLEIFKDWRIIHFFMGEVDLAEGQLHNGLSHVIQFVGQKP